MRGGLSKGGPVRFRAFLLEGDTLPLEEAVHEVDQDILVRLVDGRGYLYAWEVGSEAVYLPTPVRRGRDGSRVWEDRKAVRVGRSENLGTGVRAARAAFRSAEPVGTCDRLRPTGDGSSPVKRFGRDGVRRPTDARVVLAVLPGGQTAATLERLPPKGEIKGLLEALGAIVPAWFAGWDEEPEDGELPLGRLGEVDLAIFLRQIDQAFEREGLEAPYRHVEDRLADVEGEGEADAEARAGRRAKRAAMEAAEKAAAAKMWCLRAALDAEAPKGT